MKVDVKEVFQNVATFSRNKSTSSVSSRLLSRVNKPMLLAIAALSSRLRAQHVSG